jgi:hypothetical protein
MNILPPVTAVLAIMNQAFQSWRIWVFIKNKYVVGGLLLTALGVFISGVFASALAWVISECAFLYSSAMFFYLSQRGRSTPLHPIPMLTFSLCSLRKWTALLPVVESNLALQAVLDVTISGEPNFWLLFPITMVIILGCRHPHLLLHQVENVFKQDGHGAQPPHPWRGRIRRVYLCVLPFPTPDVNSRILWVNAAICAITELFVFRFEQGTYIVSLFALPIGRIYTHVRSYYILLASRICAVITMQTMILTDLFVSFFSFFCRQ